MPASTHDITEVRRQAHRLEAVVTAAIHAVQYLHNHTTSADGLHYATTRITAARSAANRLLTTPGLNHHSETTHLLILLGFAEATLNGPRPLILTIAHNARAAAKEEPVRDRREVLNNLEARARGLIRDADLLGLDTDPTTHLRALRFSAARNGLATN